MGAAETDTGCLLVINAGSSSIKFSLYGVGAGEALRLMARGEIENLGLAPRFIARDSGGRELAAHSWPAQAPYEALLGQLLQWIETQLGGRRLLAAGHRVAHGGLASGAPRRITPEVLADLRDCVALAPLHQPHNLAPIEAIVALHPALPQVACFDTAFHATNPAVSRLYGLPQALSAEGIRRYGFHGLSYEYIAGELAGLDPQGARGRVIVAHLGNGASMCALVDGRSVATSMGFSALDGLVMGTRCGTLDPGVILYLMQHKRLGAAAIEDLLYHQSGLLGVSALSSDMRTLLESDSVGAREAVELFVYRAAREIGSLAAAAGGVDALVFTAGIGEHAPAVRARICDQSAWLGVRLDAQANNRGTLRISAPDSAVAVWVIPTDEALMVARHTCRLIDL